MTPNKHIRLKLIFNSETGNCCHSYEFVDEEYIVPEKVAIYARVSTDEPFSSSSSELHRSESKLTNRITRVGVNSVAEFDESTEKGTSQKKDQSSLNYGKLHIFPRKRKQ